MYANLLVDDRIYSQRNYFVIYNIGTPLIDYITYINYITYLHRSSSMRFILVQFVMYGAIKYEIDILIASCMAFRYSCNCAEIFIL